MSHPPPGVQVMGEGLRAARGRARDSISAVSADLDPAELLAGVLDAIPSHLLVFDGEGQLRHDSATPIATRTAAATPDPHRAAPSWVEEVRAALQPDGKGERADAASAALARGGSWTGVLEVPALDGEPVSIDVSMRRLRGGWTVVSATERRDAGAREQAERERAATEEHLGRLGHELRTPLNAVLGFAQLLELDALSADQAESVGHVLIAGRMMATLLDEVLDLARVRGGGIDLDVGPVPVLDVAQGVLDLVGPMAGARRIRRFVEPATPLVALADRTRLWQVLLNLMTNAVKYGRDGGTLRVGIRPVTGARLRIEVEDDGTGVSPDQLDRLFQPFERLGAEPAGTGLGLALSRALVTAMGGTITASSRLGVGTVFAVELDAVDADELSDVVTPSARRVVHVSGDPASHAFVAQALRARLGAESVAVGRSAGAREVVRRTQPAAIVVDDPLPDGSASELLHSLAGDPLTALLPAVVLSGGADDPRVVRRLRAAGAHAVLAVPVSLRDLLDELGTHLDRARGDAG